MTNPWEDSETRALQLLADRATFGLSADERRELDELLGKVNWLPPDSMDLTAAAAELALVAGRLDPLPDTLRDKIRLQGHRALRETARASATLRPSP